MCHFFYFSAAVGSARSDTLFTRDQMGTNLTSKITGQVLTQLTDKLSMWLWLDKGKVWSYGKLNAKI